jgi:uncharacterized protein (TIGR02217 family)
MSFHEIRFPTNISNRSMAGSERRTQIVALGSGHEERNASWANSRRLYDAGYGVKTLDDLHAIVEFFEERRGRLYGFRWHDRLDGKSCKPSQTPQATDQVIGVGDGSLAQFQLVKKYGSAFAPWSREIKKPVAGSVRIAVDGVEKNLGGEFTLDAASGIVTFLVGSIPPDGALVTAGFEFDVPVRFDDDALKVNLEHFEAGQIPSIPIREIRI